MNKEFKFDWTKTLEKMNEKNTKNVRDERLYVPEFNESGMANAIIRFLPAPDMDVPYVEIFNHSFKTKPEGGKWFIDNCPTTIKEKCPVCDYNTDHWDEYGAWEKKRCRNKSYYGNILIVKDPIHPENNGKVFLYRFGINIFKKIEERIIPPKDSILTPVNIWEYTEGLNFKLIVKKVKINDKESKNNYDSCSFEDNPSSLGTNEQISKIISQLYPLKDYLDASKFKKYGELDKKLRTVLGNKSEPVKATTFDEAVPDKEQETEAKPNLDENIEDIENVFNQIT